MSVHLSTPALTLSNSVARRAGAVFLVLIALAAIAVHGKTGRGPKPVLAETTEVSRFVERPQIG